MDFGHEAITTRIRAQIVHRFSIFNPNWMLTFICNIFWDVVSEDGAIFPLQIQFSLYMFCDIFVSKRCKIRLLKGSCIMTLKAFKRDAGQTLTKRKPTFVG